MKKKNIAILAAWHIESDIEGNLFLPFTHYVYLDYISKSCKNVYLVAPVAPPSDIGFSYVKIDLANVEVKSISNFKGILDGQLKFFEYYNTLKSIVGFVDLFYCRVPDVFPWMPRLFFNKPCIMHFVGDTMDVAKTNEKWSWWKKMAMIGGFYPLHFLTLQAAKRSRVFVNGFPLSDKLKKKGVKATPVISSTINAATLNDEFNELNKDEVRLAYVGYLRYSKGIGTLLRLLDRLEASKINYRFNVVGNGEMYDDLREFVDERDVSDKVILHGHVDDRVKLYNILRDSDLFFFPSLSEGSPRVVIEAMSQGTPVMSTPVGSCPYVFKDKVDIRFFDFNDDLQAFNIIQEYLEDNTPFVWQRENAYKEVKEKYTLEQFLGKIFNDL